MFPSQTTSHKAAEQVQILINYYVLSTIFLLKIYLLDSVGGFCGRESGIEMKLTDVPKCSTHMSFPTLTCKENTAVLIFEKLRG